MIYGALEAGGTKMVCAIGDENGRILEQISIPTLEPEKTMPEIVRYFRWKGIEAMGIGCFGPIDLNQNSGTYGFITATPKLAWRNFDMAGYMEKALDIPVGFDTDVNGSLLGEHTWGSAKGLDNVVYITIGTGIGIGVMTNGKLLHGMMHPEGGHVLLPIRQDDTFEGICPYHRNCLEGLASGPAIQARWGEKADQLTDCSAVWDLEAHYLALAIVNYIMVLSPQRIILGGGVMHQTQLFALVREKTKELLSGYIDTKELKNMETYIVKPDLDGNQGIMGALKLGMDEIEGI